MKKVITSFAVQTVAEGKRLVATYSELNDDGTYIKQNSRFSVIAMTEDQLTAIAALEDSLLLKVSEEA